MKWALALLQFDFACIGLPHHAVARIRGPKTTDAFDLGLTPQALCLRLLRRPRVIFVQSRPLADFFVLFVN